MRKIPDTKQKEDKNKFIKDIEKAFEQFIEELTKTENKNRKRYSVKFDLSPNTKSLMKISFREGILYYQKRIIKN